MKIGLDILGGDYAPGNPLQGVLMALPEIPENSRLVLIGDEHAARSFFKEKGTDISKIEFFHSTEIIEMGAHPTKAFAQKPNSTISVGFQLLKDQKIDAFISAGNTGAMLVGSMFSVKAVPGIFRPCIASILPKENGEIGRAHV